MFFATSAMPCWGKKLIFLLDFRTPNHQKTIQKSTKKSAQQSNNEKSKKCISYWQGQWIRALGHVMLCTKFNKNDAKIPSKTTVKSTSQLGSILEPTWLHFGRVWGAKLEPSWHQIAPKVDPQNDQKSDHLFDGLWLDFYSILASNLAPKRGPQNWFFKVLGCLGATLGPSWGQDGPKTPQDLSKSPQDTQKRAPGPP